MAATTQKKVPKPPMIGEQDEQVVSAPEPPQRIKRRRSQDEMQSALSALVHGRVPQRDDDWEQVLSDAIAECIESRRILMQADAQFGAAHAAMMKSIEMMGQ